MNRGDRIGIYLEASVPQVISIFGVSQGEGVYVPINALLRPEQVMHIARDCGMKGLITSASRLGALVDILEQIPTLEFLVVVGDGEAPNVGRTIYRYDDFCNGELPATWHVTSIENDLAAILYTSGSTGKPKGVMLEPRQCGGRKPHRFDLSRDFRN